VDFVSYYIELPVMLVMFVGWKVVKGTRWVRVEEMDLVTDRYDPGVEGDGGDGDFVRSRLKVLGDMEQGWKGKVKKVGMWLFL
jgi:AAT family amino acid transporter